MDTNTANNPTNPINHTLSDQDKQIIKDEKIINLLNELTDKHIGDTASEYLSNTEYLEDVNEIFSDLQDNGYFNEEVIYYSSAIRYLKDNDPSLSESLELATEYGYTTENLNSEVLASLHASKEKERQFWEDVAPVLEVLIFL